MGVHQIYTEQMDAEGLARKLLLTPSSGPKKPWQPQTWQDLTRFSPLDFSLLSPDFRGLVLLNYTENLEKKQKIQWRASNGDGAPKLQISVPCRGRTCPDLWWPPQGPRKADHGYWDSISQNANPASSFELPHKAALQRGQAALRQSVPQSGCPHLLQEF